MVDEKASIPATVKIFRNIIIYPCPFLEEAEFSVLIPQKKRAASRLPFSHCVAAIPYEKE
jgi:hypothetical protein